MIFASEDIVFHVSAALNIALAAVIVYLTSRDKNIYDAKMLKLEYEVEKRDMEIARLKESSK